jgi:hypothetical protein
MVLDRSLKFSDEDLAGITPARAGQPAVVAPPSRASSTGNTRYP